MTPEEFAERMKVIKDRQSNNDSNIEADHGDADILMMEALVQAGYGEGAAIFDTLNLWYA